MRELEVKHLEGCPAGRLESYEAQRRTGTREVAEVGGLGVFEHDYETVSVTRCLDCGAGAYDPPLPPEERAAADRGVEFQPVDKSQLRH